MFNYKEKRAAEKAARAEKEAADLRAKYRSVETIEKEYHEYARVAGDRHYRMKCFEAEIQAVQERMFELNTERDASIKFYESQPKVETPPIPTEVPVSGALEAAL